MLSVAVVHAVAVAQSVGEMLLVALGVVPGVPLTQPVLDRLLVAELMGVALLGRLAEGAALALARVCEGVRVAVAQVLGMGLGVAVCKELPLELGRSEAE